MNRPNDISDRLRDRSNLKKLDDGFRRETFKLPLDVARAKAREILDRFPAGGYATIVERWSELPDREIEFTMRRLPTAD